MTTTTTPLTDFDGFHFAAYDAVVHTHGRVRRSQVQHFMFGNQQPANPETRKWLRNVLNTAFKLAELSGLCDEGTVTRVSVAPTGSGHVKFWSVTGPQAECVAKEDAAVRRQAMRARVAMLPLPSGNRFDARASATRRKVKVPDLTAGRPMRRAVRPAQPPKGEETP